MIIKNIVFRIFITNIKRKQNKKRILGIVDDKNALKIWQRTVISLITKVALKTCSKK